MDSRLKVLDIAVHSGPYHSGWYQSLIEYVAGIEKVIEDDFEFRKLFSLNSVVVSPRAASGLKEVDDLHGPTKICLNLESAIRQEFLAFKLKWDIATMVREE